jgi:hypothetical protein
MDYRGATRRRAVQGVERKYAGTATKHATLGKAAPLCERRTKPNSKRLVRNGFNHLRDKSLGHKAILVHPFVRRILLDCSSFMCSYGFILLLLLLLYNSGVSRTTRPPARSAGLSLSAERGAITWFAAASTSSAGCVATCTKRAISWEEAPVNNLVGVEAAPCNKQR